MRNIILLAGAAGCVLIVGTATTLAAQIGLPITETSINGGAETLSVGFAGAIIGGTTDNWTITLPGITLSSNDLPQVWVEPVGSSGFNVLSIASSDVLNFQSEFTSPPSTPDNFCGTGSPLGLGVSCFIGSDANQNAYFAAVNEVKSTVPELSTWAMTLIGFASLGFGASRLKRNRIDAAFG